MTEQITSNSPSSAPEQDERAAQPSPVQPTSITPGASEDEKKAPTETKDDSGLKFFFRVFTYNDRQGWIFNSIAMLACIASGVVLPVMDIIFGKFINVFNDFYTGQLSPEGYRTQVGKYSLFFVYLFVAKFVLQYIWTVLFSTTAIRTTKNLRVDFVRQTLRQEIAFFDTSSASISNQVGTNGNLINQGISEKLGLIIQGMSSLVAAFIIAFAVQWKLTLIIIAIVPINIVVNAITIALDTKCEYKIFDIYSESGSLAEEAFSTIRTAHAFWAFPRLMKKFDRILDDAKQAASIKSLLYAIMFPVEFFCIFAGYGLAFWQGINMYARGEIANPGTVVTVIFAVLVAAQALTQIAPQSIAISKASAAAQELFSVIDRKSQIDSLSEDGIELPEFRGNITLRNVAFTYPSRPDVPVLHSLDLDVDANKVTALVGPSGSGKSTIFGLLERWYLPGDGSSISLDGTPIEDLNLRWLRTNIRLVQQEPTLFSGTVFQNVVDGLTGTKMADLSDDTKKELVEQACRAAFAHEFVLELPNGYECWIGERGASLSGGQKQRLVIARSIISNPKVLLLDEATSALDPTAEKIVQQALNNVAKDRTMIVIAHRLSTICNADKIIVMTKGRTMEQGNHAELLEKGGIYSRLVKAQDLRGKDTSSSSSSLIEATGVDQEASSLNAELTRHSEHATDRNDAEEHQVNFGLFKGMYLILKEQKVLYWHLLIIAFTSVIGGVTYPVLAILFAKTMSAFGTKDVAQGNFFSLMFLVVAIVNLFAYAAMGWFVNIIAQHIMRTYRSELFNNCLRQDMVFFDKPENSTGALVSRVASEPTSLQELLSVNIFLILISVVNLVSSAILAVAVGWKLGLVLALGALPVLVGAGYARIRIESRLDEDAAARFAQSSGLASEAIMAMRTISSLALETTVIERYESSLKGIAIGAIGGLWWKMLFYSLSQSLSFLAMALGFWYGGRLVSTGEYTTEQFYVVFIAIVFSSEATALFFQFTTSITKARTAINYIFKIRKQVILHDTQDSDGDSRDSNEKPPGSSSIESKGRRVRCDRIGFSYPTRPHVRVLDNVDVDIDAGKMIAFVGASGCGKSSLIALLERFYDPSSGKLLSDGRNVRGLDRRSYRKDIALVQQEPVLYQGSIYDNIAIGSLDESLEPSLNRDQDSTKSEKEMVEASIIEACKQANIWTFISSLPSGLHTACGSQGLSLSGGQRQRIALARALIRRPRLLLLDEATSALDTESEKVVKEALDEAAKGRTTVAVAHRLSTVRDADLIIVFEAGKIVERGTHEELIQEGGIYHQMVLGQSLDQGV